MVKEVLIILTITFAIMNLLLILAMCKTSRISDNIINKIKNK